jgi:16S rRNA (guanine527-N7)-methyltransferase
MRSPEKDAALLRDHLDAGLEQLGFHRNPQRTDQLLSFLKLLRRWNQAYNLTAVRDPREMVSRHLLDSLSISRFLFGSPVLDAGTGAGLPGIPLAVYHPDVEFYLIDSSAKKIRFVRQAVLEIGLSNVIAVHARLESYRPARKFATIVGRALTSLAGFVAVTEHLLDRPARLLAMKGRDPRGELAILQPGALHVHRLAVPFLNAERHLIEIRYD